MPSRTAEPLDTLAQRIARQQAELEALRQEYAAQQTQLAELTQRKEELDNQLRQVAAEIQALAQGSAEPPAAPVEKPAPDGQKAGPPGKVAALVGHILSEQRQPLTARQLADEVVRRNFQTTSKDILALVQTRVGDLVHRGILRKAEGQPGVVVAE